MTLQDERLRRKVFLSHRFAQPVPQRDPNAPRAGGISSLQIDAAMKAIVLSHVEDLFKADPLLGYLKRT